MVGPGKLTDEGWREAVKKGEQAPITVLGLQGFERGIAEYAAMHKLPEADVAKLMAATATIIHGEPEGRSIAHMASCMAEIKDKRGWFIETTGIDKAAEAFSAGITEAAASQRRR